MTFEQFAADHGLLIDSVMPGKWMRVKTADKPKHRNGSYKFLGDVGFVQNHATMTEVAVWHADKASLSNVDRAAVQKRIDDLRRAETMKRAQAVSRMREYWNRLKPLRDGHPYFDGKHLSMSGCTNLRIDGENLVIPMFRGTALMSLQTITPDGEKKYRYGCPIKGNAYVMARRGSALTCLVEGFATGLAVFQSIPQATVVVCFDAANMVNVATELKVSGMCVVCADNDWETAERIGVNTGVQKGRSAAESLKCGVAYPDGIEGSDWADALIEWGERGPQKLRMEIMRHARPVFAAG